MFVLILKQWGFSPSLETLSVSLPACPFLSSYNGPIRLGTCESAPSARRRHPSIRSSISNFALVAFPGFIYEVLIMICLKLVPHLSKINDKNIQNLLFFIVQNQYCMFK